MPLLTSQIIGPSIKSRQGTATKLWRRFRAFRPHWMTGTFASSRLSSQVDVHYSTIYNFSLNKANSILVQTGDMLGILHPKMTQTPCRPLPDSYSIRICLQAIVDSLRNEHAIDCVEQARELVVVPLGHRHFSQHQTGLSNLLSLRGFRGTAWGLVKPKPQLEPIFLKAYCKLS